MVALTGRWRSAALSAIVVLAISVIGFMIVPDRLLTFLSRHVAPRTRDAIVASWWLVFFVAMCVIFTAMQRASHE